MENNKVTESELEENPNISIEQQLTDGFSHLPLSAAETTAIIIIKPESDLAVINLKAEIGKLGDYAVTREIKCDTDLTPAGEDLILVSKLKKALKEKQREYTFPIQEHFEKVNAVFKDLLASLDLIEKLNKSKISAYTDAQKARVAEAERLNREAEELARKQAKFNGGEFTVDTTLIEAPAPVRKVSTNNGSFSEVKAPNTWEILDESLIPREYYQLDIVKVNRVIRAGIRIPGIKTILNTGIRTNIK
jgi:hypothetical protein